MIHFPRLLLAAPLLLAACSINPAPQTQIPTTPVPSPAAQCGLKAAAIVVNPAINDTDTCFAQQAARSDLFEIQSSKLALQRSSNAAVKAAAQMIIDDHQKATTKLKARADKLGVTLPTDLDAAKMADMQALQVKEGEAFDRAYAAIQVNAHVDAVNLFTRYAAQANNPDFKAHATETLPDLQHHLMMARDLLNAINVK